MKKIGFILIILYLDALVLKAQPGGCILKPPQYTIHFGRGNVKDLNTSALPAYERRATSCPSDGYYSFVPYTSDCFGGDWHTLAEDHTAGDSDGNMLLVNAAPGGGNFLSIPIKGLKNNTTYELGMWLINLCRPTKKCPTLLLPNLKILLHTPEGKIVAHIVTRDLPRVQEPVWAQHRVYFTTPSNTSTMLLVMTDNAPGGCGNDFALDDITFRECVKQDPPVTTGPKIKPPPKKSPAPKSTKKITKSTPKAQPAKPKMDSVLRAVAVVKTPRIEFPAAPTILKTRKNALIRKIEVEAGDINIDIYDNGIIDGDTVSIFHNNTLIRSRQCLSQKPISITVRIDPTQPHHELIMVADNLGSIPPNTSVMIVTTAADSYKVFISSSEEKNAKVVFDLKH